MKTIVIAAVTAGGKTTAVNVLTDRTVPVIIL